MNKIEFEKISAYHPGYYIRDLVDDMDMTQDEFAKRLNITPKNLSELINGKASVSDSIAKNLSLMLGTSVELWLNLQAKYDQKLIEIKKVQAQKEEEKDFDLLDSNFFVKLGILENSKNKSQQIAILLQYFAISSFSVFKKKDFLVQFRQKNDADETMMLNSNAWIQTVINMGKQIETQPFNEKRLKAYLPKIREMSLQNPPELFRELAKLLSECGVAFVLIPSLKNSGVYGATKWINKEKVVLGITDRGKYADIFWFSFLHELGHVFQKRITKTFVAFDAAIEDGEDEKDADQFAKNLLIPENEFDEFDKESFFSEKKIIDFAHSIKVHPGIVVGRLQKEGLIPYTHLNKLREKITCSGN